MDSDLSSVVITAAKESLGYQIIGSSLGTAMFGITLLQAYIYYRRYWNDSLVLKSFVAVIVMCRSLVDTLNTVLTIHGLYTYVVDYYLDPMKILDILWSLRVELGLAIAASFLVQWYVTIGHLLAHNAHSPNLKLFLPTPLDPESEERCFHWNNCAGIGLSAVLQIHPNITVFETDRARILIGICNGSSSLCDALIAGGLCYFLHNSRSGIKQSDRLVDKLMIYAIQRGLLTTICQVLLLTTALAIPKIPVFLIFSLPEAKLYTNCLLATLNVRQSLAHPEAIDLGTRCLAFNNSTTSGTEGSQTRAAPFQSEADESKLELDLKTLRAHA
ncbi:hypothetical protein NUW54_g6031 [Trametes sanguinea]|uniref:Uncharacterized protein n=1 Tax=Trametes sanguinea TaxID=158606 RepID=A0ACC1PVH9_9APHY|nr:hypothetical protein NUW54_g6031 [Trametes sanguinea]